MAISLLDQKGVPLILVYIGTINNFTRATDLPEGNSHPVINWYDLIRATGEFFDN